MSFGVTVQKTNNYDVQGPVIHKVLTCYTPLSESLEKGFVSMTKDLIMKRTNIVNNSLAVVPAGAIIDMVEYSGVNAFTAAGDFSIGLGQLNNNPVVLLIDGGTSLIANYGVGGCRQFLSENENGDNNKIAVPYSSFVNFSCKGGVSRGSLRVDIYYHVKP